jgi:hypothetical protein
MVDRRYLVSKPSPPGKWKVFLNQHLIPRMIDASAMVEAAVEDTSTYARRNPLLAVSAALCGGLLIAIAVGNQSRHKRRPRRLRA